MSTGLAVRDLHVKFGKTELLRGIDLDVAPGETLVLFGPSGSGKTVLLRAIAGLEPAARCSVEIEGRDVTGMGPEGRGIGMAFQNFALYPHMPARANISSPLEAKGLSAAEATEKVDAVAQLLKITHVLGHAPRELSNGQKQRTALARALVGNPRVLLLDDPLRNVDAKLRYEMRLELPRLLRRAGAATIYVSQDYREAMALGDRVAILLDGQLAMVAPPEQVYDRPASVAVARLFGDPPINLLPATIKGERVVAGGLAVDLHGVPPGTPVLLGVRPETLRVLHEAESGAAPATVVAVTPLHERLVILLRTAEGTEIVASVIGDAPATGASVWIAADADAALLFDARTGLLIEPQAELTEIAA